MKAVMLLFGVPFILLSGLPSEAQTVTVDGAVEHQTIMGLGGQMESHPEYENDAEFWDLLFDEVGVSVVRVGSGGGIYPDNCCETVEHFPVFREALNHGLKNFPLGMAGPKAEWKDTGQANGGSMLPEHYDDYANLLLEYIEHVETETGITVTHFLPIPEPSIGYNGNPDSPWPHCYMSAADYRDFLKVMGPIFRAARPDVKIAAPCGYKVPVSVSYANVILADPEARGYVDVLASNGYAWPSGTNPDSWQDLAQVARQYGVREAWVPEAAHCDVCGNPTPHPAGLYIVKWIHEAFVHGNVGTWQTWVMIDRGSRSSSNMRGFVHSKNWPPDEFDSNGITKVGYAFRQFARWVRPGAVRVDAASDDPHLLVSAYRHPEQETFTVVAINDATSERTVTFTVDNLEGIDSLEAHRTSASDDGVYVGDITVVGNSFIFTLPPESTTTFSGYLSDVCIPDCAGRDCGPDGCGGMCGSCAGGEVCYQGVCTTECPDVDGDGYTNAICGGDDCNDSDDTVHPGAEDGCGDGVDQDCTGADEGCPPLIGGCQCGDRGGDGILGVMLLMLIGGCLRGRR